MLIRGQVPPEVTYEKVREWFYKKGHLFPQSIYFFENEAKHRKLRWDWCFFLSLHMTKNFMLMKHKDFGLTGNRYLSIRDGVIGYFDAMERAEKHMKTFEAYCTELGYNFEEVLGIRNDFAHHAGIGAEQDLPFPEPPPPKKEEPKPPKKVEPPKPGEPPKKPGLKINWFKLIFFVAVPVVLYTMCGAK